uniref:Ubiquitin carboxyl-terminal hydrolase 47 C-terminal domain-containing protein n=1 Tax=Amphimedon queenslandica TaxID=400682 RepID=A0A1X7VR01_AMPQE
MKIEYLRSLTSNTDSAASKLRRGMSFEIDDCKFHLKAMTRPDYQPLVDNKRIIEKLQERITLTNMELITKREHTEKIIKDIKDIKDLLKETEEKRQREKEEKIGKEMFGVRMRWTKIILFCNHPVTGELKQSFLKVHKDELLPSVLDKAYELMELAPHISIERCRLVKYDYSSEVMNQSFDLDEYQYQTIGQIMSVTRYLQVFLETRKENETFKKYNDGGINLEVSVVDLSTVEVVPAEPVRGELGWTDGELKQHIGEEFSINPSCMRIVVEEYNYINNVTSVHDVSIVGGTLKEVLYRGKRANPINFKQLLYVSSDPADYQKKYKDSLMYRIIDFHINSITLDITIPPGPEATPTTTNITERGIIMKIISINEENKGKKRKIQVQVSNSITLDQLKEELVPLIGVPPTGFRVYEIKKYDRRYDSDDEEYELGGLDEILMNIGIKSGSELIVRLGRTVLQEGEKRIKLYLLQVNNTEFCTFMMESIYAEGYTQVREFKRQIIEEAKEQGIDCVLELDKMRLRDKKGVSPGRVYLHDELIDTYSTYKYRPEKMKHYTQMQVYVIRWRPSQCSVDPIEEIILDKRYDPKDFIGKVMFVKEKL